MSESKKRGRSRSSSPSGRFNNDYRGRDEYSERRNEGRCNYERRMQRDDRDRDRRSSDRDRDRDRWKDSSSSRAAPRDDNRGNSRDSIQSDDRITESAQGNRGSYRSNRARDELKPSKSAPSVDSASDAIDFSNVVWGKASAEEELEAQAEGEGEGNVVQQKANFGLSGALAEDEATGNMKNGVVMKFCEPLDGASPDKLWRFYVFKGEDILETLHIHRLTNYVIGRDERIADIVLAHPSVSKQHCVVQFRKVEVVEAARGPTAEEQALGLLAMEQPQTRSVIRPYIMDLQSTHKTFLNGTAIEDSRYYELRPKDTLKFGMSSRDYVLVCADK